MIAALSISAACTACGSSNVDADRLAMLRKDPLALAEAPGTTLVHQLGSVGSGSGIGIGGTSPTTLFVRRKLNGSVSAATRFYAEQALRANWRTFSISCSPTHDSFSGNKQFSGWTANVLVAVDTAHGEPSVVLSFSTPDHGHAPKLLPSATIPPLTVEGLSKTCLSRA